MNIVEDNSGTGYFYVNKTIKTSVTPISSGSLSIYVKTPGVNLYTNRYDAYSVTAITPYTDQYIVVFRIPLTVAGRTGIYSYKIYIDGGTDLDVNGVNELIGSGSFTRAKSGSGTGPANSNDGYVGDGSSGKQVKFTQFTTVYLSASIPSKSWLDFSLTTSNVNVIVKGNGIEKRFNPTDVSYVAGVGGAVTVPSLPLWGDGIYTYTVVYQNNTDQDIAGTSYYKLANGMFRKFTSNDQENI